MANLIQSKELLTDVENQLTNVEKFVINFNLHIKYLIKISSKVNNATDESCPRSSSPAIISIHQQETNIDVRVVDPAKPKVTRQAHSRTESTMPISNAVGSVADDEEQEDDDIVLKYGAEHVIKLFIPVTICLLFVIISLSFISSYQESGGAHL